MARRTRTPANAHDQQGQRRDQEEALTHAPTDEAKTGRIWEKHVFVCTSGTYCPAVDGDGLGVHARLKALVKEAGVGDRVRVNHSGCLDQCGHGPMVVVYPEGVWYWGVRPEDAEEIVREHLIGGRPVQRLIYRNRPGKNKLPRDGDNRAIGRPVRPPRDGHQRADMTPSDRTTNGSGPAPDQ